MGNKTNCLGNKVLQKLDGQEIQGEHQQRIPEWKHNKPDNFIQQSRPIQENQTSGDILKRLDSEAQGCKESNFIDRERRGRETYWQLQHNASNTIYENID